MITIEVDENIIEKAAVAVEGAWEEIRMHDWDLGSHTSRHLARAAITSLLGKLVDK